MSGNAPAVQNVPIRLNKSTSYSVSRFVTTNNVDFTNKDVSIYVEPKEISDEPPPEPRKKTKKTYVKKKRATPQSWIIESSDGELYRAVPEQGQESAYYMFTEMNGYFEVSPVNNWYIIRNQIKNVKTQEQIEEEIKSRGRLESKLRKDIFQKEEEEEEEGKKAKKKKVKKENEDEEDKGESFDFKNEKSDDEPDEEPKSDGDSKLSDSDDEVSSSSSSDDDDEKEDKKRIRKLLNKGPGTSNQEPQVKTELNVKKEPGSDNMDVDANLKRKRSEEDEQLSEGAPTHKRQKRERELNEKEVIDILRRHPGITPSGLGKKFPSSINSEDPGVRKENRAILKRLITKVAKPQKEQRGDKQRTLLYLKDDIV